MVFWFWIGITTLTLPLATYGLAMALRTYLRSQYGLELAGFAREQKSPRRSMWWGGFW